MYLGRTPRFDSIEQVESAVRFVSQPFGPLTDDAVAHLTLHVTRQAADGKFEFAYDPGIAEPFKEIYAACGGKDVESWPLYDAISCPTLLLRGAKSDLLTAESAGEMTRRGPQARLVEIPGVGHAPMLLDAAQVAPVREFLLA
jgi:pimeloyl-ACP methyl ester carboxylesterase